MSSAKTIASADQNSIYQMITLTNTSGGTVFSRMIVASFNPANPSAHSSGWVIERSRHDIGPYPPIWMKSFIDSWYKARIVPHLGSRKLESLQYGSAAEMDSDALQLFGAAYTAAELRDLETAMEEAIATNFKEYKGSK